MNLPNHMVKDYLARLVTEIGAYKLEEKRAAVERANLRVEIDRLKQELNDAGREAPDVAEMRHRMDKAEAEVERLRVPYDTVQRQAQELGQARKDCDTWAARCEEAEEIIRGFLQGHNPVDRAKNHLRGYGERVA